MKIIKCISNLLESNVFLLEKNDQILIVDCGCEIEVLKPIIGDKKVVGVLLTHGHFDHSSFCNDYAKAFDCKIYASKNIKTTMTDKVAIYSEDYSTISDFDNFEFIENDCKLQLGDFYVECFSFPGHSPCCESYLIDKCLFVGDFLFEKSFGKIDLKNSDKSDMIRSLNKVENIEFDFVYSGHGNESTKVDQMKHLPVFKKFLQR